MSTVLIGHGAVGHGQAFGRGASVPRGTAPAAGPRPDAAGRIHLNRRGRVVVGLLTAVALAVLFFLVSAGVSAAFAPKAQADTAATAVDVDYVTVHPGDSLWTIASAAAPHADPRDTVAQIMELNNLSSSVVQAGEKLAVPSYR